MKAHFRFLSLCLTMLCLGAVSRAQLSGPITVPSTTYPDLASVITALNSQGVGTGGATITLTAGNPQTAPAGGYQLGSATLNASLSAAKPLVFNGNGNTITAPTGTGSNDGIWWLLGTDYVTINSFTLNDASTTTTSSSTGGMEWGFVLGKRNSSAPYDGCQYVTINNCSISLNKYVSNGTGILMAHITTTSTGPSTSGYSAAVDANSYNKFTGNTISNVSRGIFMNGASLGAAYYDKANQAGGTTAASGNTITVGGTTLSNTLYGIVSQYDSVVTVQYNKVYVGAGQSNTSIYEYYASIGVGNLNCLNNYFNITCNNTSTAVYAFYNSSAHSDVGCTHNIIGNEITGNVTTATSGTIGAIYDYYANCAQLNIQNNNIHDIDMGTATSTSAYYYGIYTYYNSISKGLNISGNTQYNIKRLGTFYYFYASYCYQYNSTGGTFYIENNTWRKLTSTSYYVYLNYNMAAYPSVNKIYYRYNTIDSLIMTGRTTYGYVYNYASYYGADSSISSYNNMTNWLGPNVNSGSAYTYYYNYFYHYYGQKGSRVSGNVMDNLIDDYAYIYNYWGYYPQYCDSNTVKRIYLGQYSGAGTNGGVYNYLGMYNGNMPTSRNNLVRDVYTNGQSYGTYFGYNGTSPYLVSNNQVRNINIGGSGSLYNYVGAYTAGGRIFGNRFDSLSVYNGTLYAWYFYGYGGIDTVYNNIVSNLRVTGTNNTNSVYGYYLLHGYTTDEERFYNNALSNIEVPTSYSSSNVYGIYLGSSVGTYKLFNNTIRINPTIVNTGAGGYGMTGIYFQNSSSGGFLDLRNNIINVNVVPGSNGITAALRRSGGTTGTAPSNFLGTSNSNIYYAPNVTNSYLYCEGTSSGSIVNGFNLSTDPAFNTPCGLFKLFVGHDQASFTENNLVPSGSIANAYVPTGTTYAEKGGTPTSNPTVTDDLAGVTRGNPSDIGDLEFSGTALDNAPPQIGYTPLALNTYCTTEPTLVATITDQTAVDTSTGKKPRLYFKRSTDANAFGVANNSTGNGWKYVDTPKINWAANTYTFKFDWNLLPGTPAAGTTIQYFIIAQDVTSNANTGANIAGFPSTGCPTSVNLGTGNGPLNATPATNQFTILGASSGFAVTADIAQICVSGNANLAINPVPLGTTVQWESATPTGSFSPIAGATAFTYSTPTLTTSTRYRAVLYCGTSVMTTTNPLTVTVNNPIITSTSSASRCGFGPLTLSANTNSGTTVNWYSSATASAPIAQGNSYTTPNLGSSVTYYASAVVPYGSVEHIKLTPTGYYSATTTSYGYGMQFHFGDTVAFYSTTVYPQNSGNISIALYDNTGNLIPASVAGGPNPTTPVAISGSSNNYTSPVTVNLGWTHIPPGDYYINCDATGTTSSLSLLWNYYAGGKPNFTFPVYSDVTGRSWTPGCYYPGSPGSSPYYWWFFYNNTISGPCENPTRYPVTATVNASTPITVSSTSSPGICAGSCATLTATSTNGTYVYYWFVGSLPNPLNVSSAAATGTSYTVCPTSTTKYYGYAVDVLSGCTAIDSITIAVNPKQPAPTITPTNPTICQNGNVALTATPVTPFGGTGTVGTGTGAIGNQYYYPSPFPGYYALDHEQYLVRASELTAAGVQPGTLTSLAFYMPSTYYGNGASNYRVKLAATTASSMTSAFICTTLTQVYYSSNYIPSTIGWNVLPFGTGTGSSTFQWDGVSNIVVDITMSRCTSCFSTPASNCSSWSYYANADSRYTSTSYSSVFYAYHYQDCTVLGCNTGSGYTGLTSNRPNMQFGWSKPYSINWTPNVTGLYKSYPPLAGPMTTADTNSKVYASPATTQVYRAVVNAVGCLSNPSNPDTVFVNPAPPTNISPAGAQTICAGDSVQLCAPSGTTNTYLWLFNGAPAPAPNTGNCYFAKAAGTYRVRVVNATTGCFDTSVGTVVNVNALPTVSISAGGATTFCNGGSVVLTGTASASPALYQWMLNGSPIAGATNATYTATTSGTYTLQVTAATQCKGISNPITVTVNTPPTTITPSGSTTFCTGGSVQLCAPTSGSGSPYTYQWYNASGAISGQTSSCYTATTSGSYYVIVVGTGFTPTCQAQSATTVVTVGAAPSSAITPSGAQNLCNGDSMLLTTNTAPGLSYQWYLNGSSNPISGATSSTYWAKTAGSYTVNVSITSSPSCNSTTSTPTVITVNPKPIVSASASGSTTFCAGDSVRLTASSTGTPTVTSWQWTLNGVNITGATGSTYTATAGGSYRAVGTTSAGCSTASSAINVTVNPLPNITVTQSGPSNICTGGSVTLTATPSTFTSYQWKSNGSAITGATTSSYSATTTGNYTVTVTDANTCSATSTPVAVIVNPLPPTNVSPSGNVSICAGNAVTLTGPCNINYSYQWKNGSSNIGSATQCTYTTGTAGTYYLRVTNNITGCADTSAAVTVTVNTPPIATATRVGPATICAGDSTQLTANTGTGLNYQWNLNGTPLAGATNSSFYAKVQGTYTVTVSSGSIANGGCSSTSPGVTITVNPAPAAFITYNSELSFCEGSAVALNANQDPNLSYVWMVNGVPTTNTSTTYVATTSGVYSLKTTNTFGCSSYSDTLRVTVYPTPQPVIVRTGTAMTTSQTYAKYQWFLNNSAIGGATSQTYVATQNGAYKVRVEDANGCIGYSDLEFVQNVGITPTATSAAIKVYPNPTTGLLMIESPVKVTLALRDVTGKVVAEASDVKQIDITKVANGMYLLYISDMEGKTLRIDKVTKTAQ